MRVEDHEVLVEAAHVLIPCVYHCNRFALVPVFASEMNHIMEAQMARGAEFDTKTKKLQLTMP